MLLLVGKFKLISSVGISGVSVASVPTAVSLVIKKDPSALLQPINTAKETISNFVSSSFESFDEKLQTEYVEFGNKVWPNISNSHEDNRAQLAKGQDVAKQTAAMLRGNAEEINYYTFVAGDLIKTLVKYLPNIVKDTGIELLQGYEGKQLFNFQKIAEIAKSPKLQDAIEGLVKVAKTHSKTLSEMSKNDTGGIIQILRELQRGAIGQEGSAVSNFLKDVGTNAKEIQTNETFCNSTKLMIRLLVGDKTKLEGIKTMITELKSTMADMKVDIEGIEGLEGMVDEITEKLEEINNKENLGDPCTADTQ